MKCSFLMILFFSFFSTIIGCSSDADERIARMQKRYERRNAKEQSDSFFASSNSMQTNDSVRTFGTLTLGALCIAGVQYANSSQWPTTLTPTKYRFYSGIQQNFSSQIPDVKIIIEQTADQHDFYQTYGLDAHFLSDRRDATEKIRNSGADYQHQTYILAPAAAALLTQCQVNTAKYVMCYGNQLQQTLHQECLSFLEHTAALSISSPLYDYKPELVGYADVAHEYNQQGLSRNAIIMLDCCWMLLDFGKAIAQGVAEGIVDAARSVIEHPLETALCLVAGEYVLAYQLSKVLFEIAQIGVITYLDPQEGTLRWQEYIEPINQTITAIAKQEIKLRDCVKGAARFVTSCATQKKLLRHAGSFYQKAKNKALAYARANQSGIQLQPLNGKIEQCIATAVKQEIKNCPASCVNQYQNLKEILRIKEFTSIIKATKHGVERLIERGFTPEETIKLISHPCHRRIQSDGAKVFIQNIDDKFKIIILNETTGEIVTAIKNTTRKKIMQLGKRYGWKL